MSQRLIGLLVVLIRNFSGYPEGTMFSILIGNMIAPLIDESLLRLRVKRRRAAA